MKEKMALTKDCKQARRAVAKSPGQGRYLKQYAHRSLRRAAKKALQNEGDLTFVSGKFCTSQDIG